MPQSHPPPQQDQAPVRAQVQVQVPAQAQTQPRQANLNFITFGEPQQSPSNRAIRSHAAKAGWKSRKKSRSVAAASQTPLPRTTAEHVPAALLAPPRRRDLPAVPSWPTGDMVSRAVVSLARSTSHSSHSTNSSRSTPSTVHSPDGIMDDPDLAKYQVVENDEEDIDSLALPNATDLTLSEAQCARLFKPHQLGSTHDPFQQFPVRWEEPFGALVQFYRTRIGEVWMGMIAVDWGQQGNTDFVDFPLQVSIAQREPAMFYAVLSNTSVMAPPSNAISMRQQPFMSQWLRHKAVEALRKAITDPARAYTDSVILTVIYVYFNEALRSEHDIAIKVHAPALKRMVAARGGLGVIASNGKDGLILSRYLTWCDRIVANTLGIPLLFEDYVEDPTVGQTQWNGMWSKVQTIM